MKVKSTIQDTRYKIHDKNIVHRASSIMHLNAKLFPNHRGFTLIETIVVMVVIVILAAVVVVRNPFNDIKIYGATRKVAADIRYVQKLSISNQTRAGITFNANGYTVYSNIVTLTQARSSGDSCSTDASNNFVVDFTQGRCSNYKNVRIAALPSTNPIAFNSIGTPVDSGGAIAVNQIITLSLSGASSQSITIEAGTGRVSY